MAFHSVLPENEQMAFQVALKWLQLGMKSVFLQDADTLIIKLDSLVEILLQIRKYFLKLNASPPMPALALSPVSAMKT
jgi:hypothetical protein